jgi:hypothetical protein
MSSSGRSVRLPSPVCQRAQSELLAESAGEAGLALDSDPVGGLPQGPGTMGEKTWLPARDCRSHSRRTIEKHDRSPSEYRTQKFMNCCLKSSRQPGRYLQTRLSIPPDNDTEMSSGIVDFSENRGFGDRFVRTFLPASVLKPNGLRPLEAPTGGLVNAQVGTG